MADIPAEPMPIARRFAETPEFASSPLYTSLARVVARAPALLRLAARGRPGQHPTQPSPYDAGHKQPVEKQGRLSAPGAAR